VIVLLTVTELSELTTAALGRITCLVTTRELSEEDRAALVEVFLAKAVKLDEEAMSAARV